MTMENNLTPHPPEAYGVKSTDANSHCSASSGSVGECTECDDRWHHTWRKADAVCVDIYKTGEIVVLVKIGDRTEILECNPQNSRAHSIRK